MTTRRTLASWMMLVAGAQIACTGDSDRQNRVGTAGEALPAAVRDSIPTEDDLDRARAAANSLAGELQAELLAALDSGGPSSAVAFCADSAQALTARHAREGVYLRRVSMRLRNPANRPDAVEEILLRELDSLHRAGALPGEVVRVERSPSGEGLVQYARPILVVEGCLACHGEQERLAPGVGEILAARYPSDRATGYRSGDLRGMISVRLQR